MGFIESTKTCYITDLPTVNIWSTIDRQDYFIDLNGKQCNFAFARDHKNSEFVERNKHILKGLLLNEKMPTQKDNFYDNNILENIIIEAQIPKSPKAKLDNLLLFLNKNQEYEGAAIDLKKLGDHDLLITKLYFLNHNEYWFYLNTLKEQNFLNFQEVASNYGTDAFQIKFTYKGLEHVIDLLESGENSKYCFIAMSFSKSAENIRSAIKKVLHETSFEPILVDELHYESDLTINDAIIMNIRKSKFLIADFTEQKHGVYFEAGFALGLKRPVIYTCSEEDFNKTHFDTNHYPHIVYTTMPDLERKLKDKIEAWIE